MMENSPESASTTEWVEQLYAPETRRAARQKLVAARAVEPLVACLDSPNQSVVWAAVVSLGELRAAEATERLVALLERGVLEWDVCGALVRITGEDLGTDPRRWRKSLGTRPKASSFDAAECIAQTSEFLGVKANASGGGTHVFQLSTAEGRTQKVAVLFDRRDARLGELVVIYSECGPANPKHYETLLRKNLGMPFGAFAIRDLDGQANLIIVETMAAASVTPGVLAGKIEQIAARADQVENQLTRQDVR
ncbi:MAG TPA: hypothetical protein VJL29_14410 [Thermoguttaceae bacterium]|nr:hypothetical protein [Thermoguttaceae bacterium]